MADLGTMYARLVVDTTGMQHAAVAMMKFQKQANTSLASVEARVIATGGAMKTMGRTMSQFLTLPLLLVGGASFKMYKDFEFSMNKVVSLVGVARKQVDEWSASVLKLAPSLGKGPVELADAMYFITSAGIRGKETMEILEESARSSAGGLGEVKVVADLLTSAMNAYGKENLNAARANDILVATVREGKAEADLLAQSMGLVLPIASAMGASFDQVGAATAAMTRTGTKAATAAIQLRQIFNSILKPAKEAEEAFIQMKTSGQALRDMIREKGLLAALMELKRLQETYGEDTLGKVIPNIRSLTGVLDIMGSNLEANKKIFEEIENSVGDARRMFEETAQTVQQRLNMALTKLKVAAVEFGKSVAEVVIPMLQKLGDFIEKLTERWSQLSDAQKRARVTLLLFTAALGPFLIVTGFLVGNIFPLMIKAIRGIGWVATAMFGVFAKGTIHVTRAATAMKGFAKAGVASSIIGRTMGASLIGLDVIVTKMAVGWNYMRTAVLSVLGLVKNLLRTVVLLAGPIDIAVAAFAAVLFIGKKIEKNLSDQFKLEEGLNTLRSVGVKLTNEQLGVLQKLRGAELSREIARIAEVRQQEYIKENWEDILALKQRVDAVDARLGDLGSADLEALGRFQEDLNLQLKQADKLIGDVQKKIGDFEATVGVELELDEGKFNSFQLELMKRASVLQLDVKLGLADRGLDIEDILDPGAIKSLQLSDALEGELTKINSQLIATTNVFASSAEEQADSVLQVGNSALMESQRMAGGFASDMGKATGFMVNTFVADSAMMGKVWEGAFNDRIETTKKATPLIAKVVKAGYEEEISGIEALKSVLKAYFAFAEELAEERRRNAEASYLSRAESEALQTMEKQLQSIEIMGKLAWSELDVAEAKVKTFEQVLKSLADIGFDETDPRMQKFASTLLTLQDRMKVLEWDTVDLTESLKDLRFELEMGRVKDDLFGDFEKSKHDLQAYEKYLEDLLKKRTTMKFQVEEVSTGPILYMVGEYLKFLKATEDVNAEIKATEDTIGSLQIASIYEGLEKGMTKIDDTAAVMGDGFQTAAEKAKFLGALMQQVLTIDPSTEGFEAAFKRIQSLLQDFSGQAFVEGIQKQLDDAALSAELFGHEFKLGTEQVKILKGAIDNLTSAEGMSLPQKQYILNWINSLIPGAEQLKQAEEFWNTFETVARTSIQSVGQLLGSLQQYWGTLMDNEIRIVEDTAKRKHKSEKWVARESEKIRKDYGKKMQTAAIAEAVVNQAAAVVGIWKAYSNIPGGQIISAIMTGVMLGATGVQIATIKAQKFAKGGVIPPGHPNDTFPALLTSGEMVLPEHKWKGILTPDGELLKELTSPVALKGVMDTTKEVVKREELVEDFTKIQKFGRGGIVPPGYPDDDYPAMLSSGEIVLPEHKWKAILTPAEERLDANSMTSQKSANEFLKRLEQTQEKNRQFASYGSTNLETGSKKSKRNEKYFIKDQPSSKYLDMLSQFTKVNTDRQRFPLGDIQDMINTVRGGTSIADTISLPTAEERTVIQDKAAQLRDIVTQLQTPTAPSIVLPGQDERTAIQDKAAQLRDVIRNIPTAPTVTAPPVNVQPQVDIIRDQTTQAAFTPDDSYATPAIQKAQALAGAQRNVSNVRDIIKTIDDKKLDANFEPLTDRFGKFAAGGVVPQGYPKDSYPALLSSGETVLPPEPLGSAGGTKKIDLTVTVDIEGDKLLGIVRKQISLDNNY